MDEILPPDSSTPKEIWRTFKLRKISKMKEGVDPFNFQYYSVYKALSSNPYVLGLGTGTGKTLCSQLTYFYFQEKREKTKLVILTSKSAILQFRQEFDKFFDHTENIIPLYQEMPKRGRTYAQARIQVYQSIYEEVEGLEKIDGFITTYASFLRDYDYIYYALKEAKKRGYHIVFVADEAHNFKALRTKTSKCVRELAREIASKTVALTATMTKGKLEDIYGMFKNLGVSLTKTKREFVNRFCLTVPDPRKDFGYKIVGYKNVDEFVQLIRPHAVVLRKTDVAEFLPPFTLQKHYLDQSKEQWDTIAELYAGLAEITNAQGEDVKLQGVAKIGFIKQVLLDPQTILHGDSAKWVALRNTTLSPKAEEIIRLMNEEFSEEKIIIYSHSKKYVKHLETVLKHNPNVPAHYANPVSIHGDITSAKERDRRRLAFTETEDHNVILLTDAGGESINLQVAGVLIVASLPPTGGNLIQLAGRLSRIGTTHKNLLLLFLLMKDSQDEDEYTIIHQQMQIMSMVQGEVENGLIDWEHLKAHKRNRNAEEPASVEEYKEQATTKLLLAQRKKRQSSYIKKHKGIITF